MSEHAIQNTIRNALAGVALVFRANIGQAWTGDVTRVSARRIIIDNPRPFSTGLPPGFSDLFGLVPVTITQEMVGQRVAIFTALEVKTAKGRASEKQANFLKAVNDNGGRAGIVRSVDDALRIVGGGV